MCDDNDWVLILSIGLVVAICVTKFKATLPCQPGYLFPIIRTGIVEIVFNAFAFGLCIHTCKSYQAIEEF